MIKTKYLRRHFIEQAVYKFKPYGKILEIGSGDKLRYYKNSITLNRDESTNPDILGDAEDMKFENDAFDFIVCLEVLEHTKSPEKIINEIYRCLKPNGKLLLSVPFVFEIHATPDYYRFTRYGIEHLLRNFRNVNIENNGGKYCVIFHFMRLNLIGRLTYYILNNLGYFMDYIIPAKPIITLGYTVTAEK